MFKSLSALVLFAAIGLAHAQSGQGEVLRADANVAPDRGSFSAGTEPAGAALRDAATRREACSGRGEAACAKASEREAADAGAAAATGSGPALMWAALGVIAFVALRRRPRA